MDVGSLLSQFLVDPVFVPMQAGGTDASLYHVHSVGRSLVLKTQQAGPRHESLAHDERMYRWLTGKLPVPEVLFFETVDGVEYLCMTRVEGKLLSDHLGHWPAELWVKRYAEALRMLHALRLDQDAPEWSIQERLTAARFNIEQGEVDQDAFEQEYRSMSPHELYRLLESYLPADIDPVFTHGDYCPDNLLFDDGVVSGFIDMGRGGRADRYQDVAIAIRCIRGEFGEEMVSLFQRHYGMESLDERKMKFYTLLDEFY